MGDDWYWTVGNVLGGLVAVVSFFGSWIYCASEYGYLLGFGLGWLPSIILAIIMFFATKLLWGPAAFAVGGLILIALNQH